MKHLKIYEEISSSVSSELLGIDPKFLTKEYCLHLYDRYGKSQDAGAIEHLTKLIGKNHPEYRDDAEFIRKIEDLNTKYNLEDLIDTLPVSSQKEVSAIRKEYQTSKDRLRAIENLEKGVSGVQSEMKDLIPAILTKHGIYEGNDLAQKINNTIKEILEDYKKTAIK